jgi:hypothetical protein
MVYASFYPPELDAAGLEADSVRADKLIIPQAAEDGERNVRGRTVTIVTWHRQPEEFGFGKSGMDHPRTVKP